MKLIVGLGNPGKEYENTRHNIGFMFVDYYISYKSYICNWKKKFNGLFTEITINNEKVMFLKPQSYMNLSGEVVKKVIDYYKISIDDILIISDDLDLNVGNFKLKPKGSSGGHNGLKNIELNLGSSSFKRLKIGISNNKNIDTKDYVLCKFSSSELNTYNNLFNDLVSVIDDYLEFDFSVLMNKYNQKNR